ncbi:hypothetical protein [Tessaracoccus sp.]
MTEPAVTYPDPFQYSTFAANFTVAAADRTPIERTTRHRNDD